MSMNQDTLTLEESNKVRVSLGLAPIGVELAEGEEAPVDEDEIAEANFAERRAQMKKEKDERCVAICIE
jgi:U4/U6.U5 tri-snRNP-associated protein 1